MVSKTKASVGGLRKLQKPYIEFDNFSVDIGKRIVTFYQGMEVMAVMDIGTHLGCGDVLYVQDIKGKIEMDII